MLFGLYYSNSGSFFPFFLARVPFYACIPDGFLGDLFTYFGSDRSRGDLTPFLGSALSGLRTALGPSSSFESDRVIRLCPGRCGFFRDLILIPLFGG